MMFFLANLAPSIGLIIQLKNVTFNLNGNCNRK